MSIMHYVQAGLVLGIVFVIQIIKGFVDKSHLKKELPCKLWLMFIKRC